MDKLFDLSGRVALVTGAASGIGRGAAELLAAQGAAIAAVDADTDDLKEVVQYLESSGSRALLLPADISDADQVQRVVTRAGEELGRLDIVFANAGINGVWAPLEKLEPEEWDRTINVNLRGTFLTVKYAVPYLKKQGGSIIITSSINGTRVFSNTGATAYSCTKAAQVAFAKMTALELAECGIRVNVICPGTVDTAIHEKTVQRDLEHVGVPAEFPEGTLPLSEGKAATSEQVARLVAFLASDASDHITGTEVWIDGAQSLIRG